VRNGEVQVSNIKHQHVIAEENTPVGVIIDISTFERIESILEDYGFAQFINEADDEEPLEDAEAQKMIRGPG
jgi:PHD/YefM family antitoxin component YafN of YafNO toxin-antitoxin module